MVKNTSKPKILLVTTGGTIESFYNPEEGTPETVPQEKKSCIPDALHSIAEARKALASGEVTAVELTQAYLDRIEVSSSPVSAAINSHNYDHYPLCMKDSKEVFPEHLAHLAAYIYEHEEYESVIIVHGTDTMPRHGRKLRELLAEYDASLGEGGTTEKKIIFAGAMEPLRDKNKQWRAGSDGWAHLSLAFAAANDSSVAPDIYFTYQNKLLKAAEWDKFRKVDEATNTVIDSTFIERVNPSPEEKAASRTW